MQLKQSLLKKDEALKDPRRGVHPRHAGGFPAGAELRHFA